MIFERSTELSDIPLDRLGQLLPICFRCHYCLSLLQLVKSSYGRLRCVNMVSRGLQNRWLFCNACCWEWPPPKSMLFMWFAIAPIGQTSAELPACCCSCCLGLRGSLGLRGFGLYCLTLGRARVAFYRADTCLRSVVNVWNLNTKGARSTVTKRYRHDGYRIPSTHSQTVGVVLACSVRSIACWLMWISGSLQILCDLRSKTVEGPPPIVARDIQVPEIFTLLHLC